MIEENFKVSEGCKIGENTIIKFGSVIEDDVVIGDNCVIGPYAHIHTHSVVGDNCIIGNFVEVKNSKLGKGCKAKHMTYIGDCECGDNVNFGCGVVIANYNGKEKNKTIIKSNSFIGCNSNLVAPLSVGENSFIAAGSTINEDVNDNEFAIERSKEIHKIRKSIK